MGGSTGIRADTVKQYKKSENKWRKELKTLKEKNKMLYNIAKKSGSRLEINNIKKIREKDSNKCCHSISGSSSDDSDSDLLLARDSS